MASPVSPSPVTLSAVGVVIIAAVGLSLGLARGPAPLPSDVSAPVTLAPASAHPSSDPRERSGQSDDGDPGKVVVVPNRPYRLGGDGSPNDASGKAGVSSREHPADTTASVTTTLATTSYRLGGSSSGADKAVPSSGSAPASGSGHSGGSVGAHSGFGGDDAHDN